MSGSGWDTVFWCAGVLVAGGLYAWFFHTVAHPEKVAEDLGIRLEDQDVR